MTRAQRKSFLLVMLGVFAGICFSRAINYGLSGRYWIGQAYWAGFVTAIGLWIWTAFVQPRHPQEPPPVSAGLGQKVGHKVERFLWIGDGMDSGSDQVGRPVDLDGRKGKVIAGTVLTVDIEFE